MDFSEMLRVGTVTAKDSRNMMCRVTFQDTQTDACTSQFLPVLVNRAFADTYYDLPDIGSKVLCIFLPNGKETGFVLGSFYPRGKAPEADENIYRHTFKDGTFLEYDRVKHKLTVSCVGDAEILAKGNVELTGNNVSVTAQGTISLQASKIIAQE